MNHHAIPHDVPTTTGTPAAGKPAPAPAAGRNFIVLESDFRGEANRGGAAQGFSGGVVLNAAKEAVGLIVTTGTNHFNALLLSDALFSKVEWKPLTEVQKRKF